MDAGGTATTECPPNRGSLWKHESPRLLVEERINKEANKLIVRELPLVNHFHHRASGSFPGPRTRAFDERLVQRLVLAGPVLMKSLATLIFSGPVRLSEETIYI